MQLCLNSSTRVSPIRSRSMSERKFENRRILQWLRSTGNVNRAKAPMFVGVNRCSQFHYSHYRNPVFRAIHPRSLPMNPAGWG